MSEDFREPEPERESAFGRHLREQRRRGMPWIRLAVMVGVLVGLIVFYENISRGVAGCFGRYVEADKTKKQPDASGVPDGMLRIEPAKSLKPADATP